MQILTRNSKHNFISCPDTKRVESFLRDTIAFSDSIQCGDQVCYPCYVFNQMLKSDVCMLASADIVEGKESLGATPINYHHFRTLLHFCPEDD